ncbi:MAG TPA: response regulator [Thermoanaerobaculia bacterium]|jgi:two-component system sensor histidine kinase/response regulator|nr:response regulator [Thermoanaerobaculia bacterium]
MNLPLSHSVLVVDDDPSIRLLLTTFLQRQGFRSLKACNGREALEAMRAGKSDLVILDLMMPWVSGWDVLRQRAADPSLQQISVIVTTACNSREVIADLQAMGVFAVLEKPFDLETLLTAVTACFAHAPFVAAA